MERPKETFLYVIMNIISLLISQNQLHTLNATIIIISLGGFYAPSNTRARKNIEAFFIAIMRPSLNDQIDSDALIRFRNGVT